MTVGKSLFHINPIHFHREHRSIDNTLFKPAPDKHNLTYRSDIAARQKSETLVMTAGWSVSEHLETALILKPSPSQRQHQMGKKGCSAKWMALYIGAFESRHFRQLLSMGDGDVLEEIYSLARNKNSLKAPSEIKEIFNSLSSAIQGIQNPSRVCSVVEAADFDHAPAKTAWDAYWGAILKSSGFNNKMEEFLHGTGLDPFQLLHTWHRRKPLQARPTPAKSLKGRQRELVTFLLGESVQISPGSQKLVERLYGECWDRRSRNFDNNLRVFRTGSEEIKSLWNREWTSFTFKCLLVTALVMNDAYTHTYLNAH
jgi:hypothetical protein